MTIRRGQPWGEPGSLGENCQVATDDRSLSTILEALLLENLDQPDGGEVDTAEPGSVTVTSPAQAATVGLTGGDLHRSVGAPRHSADDLYQGPAMRLPIDVGLVELVSEDVVTRHLFAAHMLATKGHRGGLWSTRTVIVMNGSFRGEANLGPKAHPNDGRLDVVDGRLGLADRRRARKRMLTGTHVPHPALIELRVRDLVVSDDHEFDVALDGTFVGSAKELRIRCIPDAAVIVV